jgi:type IV secretory pathway VirJ component
MRILPSSAKIRRRLVALAASLCAITSPPCLAGAAASSTVEGESQTMSHGLFTDVQVHRPAGGARQFAMLVTEGVVPTAREARMRRTMLDEGAMVATVPFAPFYRKLAAQDGKCTYGPGAFENLSRHLQALEHLPGYLLPILVGADSAAPYVYSVLAQAPAGTFESGLSLGFSPRLALKTPPCPISALRQQSDVAAGIVDILPPSAALGTRWTAVQDEAQGSEAIETARAFVQRVPQAEWVALYGDRSSVAATAAFERAYRQLAMP